ncbi:uncharacterized protein IL334_007685 [Kwoniella shivajii]|uniref:Uncharacterized protein n=1 Tax=Kwoniella shivajii TaxID=564305 RepID=A0ABZ1D9C7_9TREE|nr:hypothetical protein IL334_007685 [Kwoniella shivajii]
MLRSKYQKPSVADDEVEDRPDGAACDTFFAPSSSPEQSPSTIRAHNLSCPPSQPRSQQETLNLMTRHYMYSEPSHYSPPTSSLTVSSNPVMDNVNLTDNIHREDQSLAPGWSSQLDLHPFSIQSPDGTNYGDNIAPVELSDGLITRSLNMISHPPGFGFPELSDHDTRSLVKFDSPVPSAKDVESLSKLIYSLPSIIPENAVEQYDPRQYVGLEEFDLSLNNNIGQNGISELVVDPYRYAWTDTANDETICLQDLGGFQDHRRENQEPRQRSEALSLDLELMSDEWETQFNYPSQRDWDNLCQTTNKLASKMGIQ